jgi:hypothetical protein
VSATTVQKESSFARDVFYDFDATLEDVGSRPSRTPSRQADRKRAGMADLRIRDLRHTFVTWMGEQGTRISSATSSAIAPVVAARSSIDT